MATGTLTFNLTLQEHLSEFGATFPIYGAASSPPSFYDSTRDKTYTFYQGFRNGRRSVELVIFDNRTKRVYPPIMVSGNVLVDDDHGVPAGRIDHEGYLHCLHFPHGGNMLHTVSLSTTDYRFFKEVATISGSYTYPHIELVGSTLWLIMREQALVAEPDLKFRGCFRYTETLSGGQPEWSDEQLMIDFGTDSRCYFGDVELRDGTDLHWTATRANSAETQRQHIYCGILDTTDRSVRNWTGDTVVDVGDLPVDLDTMNDHFRLYEHGVGAFSSTPSRVWIDGKPHLIFRDGPDETGTAKHMYWTGLAWTTPATIPNVTLDYRNDGLTAFLNGDGNLEFWYPDDPDNDFDRGGNANRVIYSSGAWGSVEVMKTIADGPKSLNTMYGVRDGAANDFRVLITECTDDPAYSSADSIAGGLKLYGHSGGSSGKWIKRPSNGTYLFDNAEAETYVNRLSTSQGYDNRHYYDNLFEVLKAIGLSKFDCLGFDRADLTESEALMNIVSTSYGLTKNGTVTRTTGRGWTGNGSDGYFSTGFTPSTAGGAMTQTSAHVGAYVTNASGTPTAPIMSTAASGNRLALHSVHSGSAFTAGYLNETSNFSFNSLGPGSQPYQGHTVFSRNGTSVYGLRNGVSFSGSPLTRASTGLPNNELLLLSDGSAFSTYFLWLWHWGAYLTTTEITDLFWKGIVPFKILSGVRVPV